MKKKEKDDVWIYAYIGFIGCILYDTYLDDYPGFLTYQAVLVSFLVIKLILRVRYVEKQKRKDPNDL